MVVVDQRCGGWAAVSIARSVTSGISIRYDRPGSTMHSTDRADYSTLARSVTSGISLRYDRLTDPVQHPV